ncbi:protein of unknown function [Paraburkholderia kururiensis]
MTFVLQTGPPTGTRLHAQAMQRRRRLSLATARACRRRTAGELGFGVASAALPA